MWKRIVALIIGLLWILSPAIPVLASDSVDVTVTARGIASDGITGFTIIYVTDTHFDLTWTLGSNITGIMIRAKYGEYPHDISSANETPSDGYLVYYGSGSSTNDTSMNLDQNPGGIYYRAWAQRADGSWVVTPEEGWKESKIVTLLAFFALPGIVSFLSLRSSYYILKVFAGIAWWIAAMFWISSPPSMVTKGTPVDVGVIIFLFLLGIVFFFFPFWSSRFDNGQEIGGRLRLPFMRTDEQEGEERKRRYLPNRRERNNSYEARVEAALRGERRR